MGDFKANETFQDSVYIETTATGLPKAGLATVTCTWIRISNNTRTAGTVQEVGSGWYRVSDFTPTANEAYATEWAAGAAGYTIYGNYKLFKVGGGALADVYALIDTEIATIDAEIGVIDGLHDVPAKDAVTNSQMRDVIGNKTDDPDWFVAQNQSLMGYAKAGAATGGGVSYAGICDVGMGASQTVIVCDDLLGFGDDFFNTDWVMEVALNDNSHGNAPEGNAPRDIQDYVSATGTFTTAAFSANVEANDRIVVSKRHLQVIDKTALAATPTVNSLAYKLSRYVGDGDGDFATGSVLPSNVSLYDILGGANGHPAFPAAAAPANGVSLAEVLHLVADRTEHHLVTRTWFSPSQEEVALTAGAGDKALPSVTLPNITGTIVHVYAGFKFRMIENTNVAANKLNGVQDIQVRVDTPGAWADGINFVDDQFSLAASTREGGDCIVGTIDLVGTVTAFNDIYEFQWDEGVADVANLQFNDVQTFLIVSYY